MNAVMPSVGTYAFASATRATGIGLKNEMTEPWREPSLQLYKVVRNENAACGDIGHDEKGRNRGIV